MRASCYVVGLLGALGVAAQVAAKSDCEKESADCVTIGKLDFSIGVGYGSRSNPIVNGHDIPLILIPQFSYYGKRFFIENFDVGVTLHESATNTFNLVGSPGYDRVFFYRNDLQNFFIGGGFAGSSVSASASAAALPPVATGLPGLPGTPNIQVSDADLILERKRHATYLVGPEWNFKYGAVFGQLDALYEVTGQHNGTEIRAAIAVPLIRSAGTLTASAGATWKSSEVVTYFYGEKGIYDAGAALNPFAKISYTLALNDHWNINALAHIERLGDAIADSPIVQEKNVTTIFAGVAYSF
jgi:outer membrane protein